jgi:Amt family ammonium transporter
VHAENSYDHGVLGHGTTAHATVLTHSSDRA